MDIIDAEIRPVKIWRKKPKRQKKPILNHKVKGRKPAQAKPGSPLKRYIGISLLLGVIMLSIGQLAYIAAIAFLFYLIIEGVLYEIA